MVGPSQFLGFTESPIIVAFGLLIGGAGGYQLILALPEAIHQANRLYPGNEEHNVNFCSGIFNAFLGFGQIVGPLFGSNLTSSLGFRTTQDILALITLVFGVIYLFFGGGIEAFRSLRSNKNKSLALSKKVSQLGMMSLSLDADQH